MGCECVYDPDSLIFAVSLHIRKIRRAVRGWRDRSDARDIKAEPREEYFYTIRREHFTKYFADNLGDKAPNSSGSQPLWCLTGFLEGDEARGAGAVANSPSRGGCAGARARAGVA